jgi:TatD DNase family protein
LIDTHCHLDTPAFDADREAVLARAMAAGVRGIVVPAIRPRTWPALVAAAEQFRAPPIRIALGIHPQIVPDIEPGEADGDIDELADQIVGAVQQAGANAVAVGECGLDGPTGDLPRQEAVFRAHIRAARTVGKPLVVHVLRAHDLAPRVLREEKADEVGGVMHSYSGGEQLVRIYCDLGMYFSFAGPVTYPNARKPLEALRAIPDDRLLAETDAPDQSPFTHRGERSEPAFVADVIAGLASVRGVSAEDMAALTTRNARTLFRDFGVDSDAG